MEKFLEYIHSLMPFSDNNWQILMPALSKRDYKINEFLLKEGEICDTLFFIDKGYCKS